MKFTLNRLRIGDTLTAQVVERVRANEYIVSFRGDLIRVRSENPKPLAVHERVLVRVVALNPLAFQFVSGSGRIATRMDVSI